MLDVSVRVMPWRQWPGFAPAWEQVHETSADPSFFLSREWVDCWLATFGEELNPELLAFEAAGAAVGCCLLVWRTEWVRAVPLRRVYLNCAGESAADSTCIEYNSLLTIPQYEAPVAQALAGFLQRRYWDELLLYGVGGQTAICALGNSLGTAESSEKPSHYVDFRQVREAAAGFDSSLSSNTRQQIRRSLRLYEEAHGPCTLHVAQTVGEATEVLEHLAELHQGAWRERGRPGVFASQRFLAFHQRLIAQTFDAGRILLAEVLSGGEVIGAVYSFVYHGRVYFYQSGFRYTSDGRLKPGLVTHYLAIRYCLDQPAILEYDFLAGDSQYKRSLATSSRPLRWTCIRRLTPSTMVFRGLRQLKRKYVQTLKTARGLDRPPGGTQL